MEPQNNLTTDDNGKTAGIISYLSIIGWLIAYFAFHANKKTELGSYQLRQTLLLHIAHIAFYFIWNTIIVSLLFASVTLAALVSTVTWVFGLGFFVLWIIGFIGAINGEKKPIPLLGDKAQTLFAGI